MKLKFFLLLPYFGVISFSGAQDIAPLSQKDSADILVALAETNYRAEPEHAEALAQRAHRHAVQANYVAGQARALHVLGNTFNVFNRTQESTDAYLKAARLFESLNDSLRAGNAYNQAASVYIYKLRNHTKAYQYCAAAVSLLQKDSGYLQAALTNLAALHMQTGKTDKALELYQTNYKAYRKKNDLARMCTALNNLATAYDCKKDFKSSVACYERALAIGKALNDFRQTTHILLGLAPAYCSETGDHQRAVEMLTEAVSLSVTHELYDKHIYALQCLVAEWEHLGKMDNAQKIALETLELSNHHGLSYLKGDIYKQLSHIYQKQGLPDKALQYHQQYAHFADSTAQQEHLALAGVHLSDTSKHRDTLENRSLTPVSPFSRMILAGLAILIAAGVFMLYRDRKRKESRPHTDPKKESQPPVEAAPAHAIHAAHLEVVNGEGIHLLPLDAIWWFQKEGKGYQAFTETGNYRVRQSIREIEQILPSQRFFRINRAVIINTRQMNNYSFWENHKYIIRMKDPQKTEFMISRNRLREMKETFRVLEGS